MNNTMETFNGHVRSPNDAIILFEACRVGLLPRVQRRLSEKERQQIKSGSIFVWDEREAGMRRWTDGKSWSASRVSGSFLTYREMEGKRGGNSFDKSANRDGVLGNEGDSDGGPDGYRYKPDGLMKQSFSITTNNGQHLHLISYYSRQAGAVANLMVPSQAPHLRNIRPEKGMYPDSTVHEQSSIPPITRGPMEVPGYSHSPSQAPYARSPYAYPPWAPPSPMHTPPPHAQYGPYYSPHPHSYGTHPAMHGLSYPPHPQAYGHPHPSSMTIYDRPPPTLSNGALPPPGSHTYPHPLPPAYAPPYYGTYSYPPPQAHHAPPYGAAHPPAMYEPRHTVPDVRSKESAPSPTRDERHETSSGAKPLLVATERPAVSSAASSSSLPPANITSSQKIPSIHTMLNQTEEPQRKPSRSPPLRPLQDIPSHKLGFEANRDMHTLRNLDKSTLKF